MSVDPRHLKTFLAVVRAGSITEGARQLNISQPSVSLVITQLERSMDAKLFDRARGGIKLTSVGEALRYRAEAMETLLLNVQRDVALVENNIAGPLAIGGTTGALVIVLVDAIAALSQKLPRLDLQILERVDKDLPGLLRSEKIELAICPVGTSVCPPDLVEINLIRDAFTLIVGRANSHLPDVMQLSDMSDFAWVLPDAMGGFRSHIDALFITGQAAMPDNVIRCDSIVSTKAIVSETHYVSILPRRVVAPELATGALRAIRISGADLVRHIGVHFLAERPLSGVASAFLDVLRAMSAADEASGH
jgi:LysR family transcriptional regulator, regulator of abg operon